MAVLDDDDMTTTAEEGPGRRRRRRTTVARTAAPTAAPTVARTAEPTGADGGADGGADEGADGGADGGADRAPTAARTAGLSRPDVTTTAHDDGGPGARRSRPALRRCIRLDPDEFAARYWSRAAAAVAGGTLRAATSTTCSALAAVDELLSAARPAHAVPAAGQGGRVVDAAAASPAAAAPARRSATRSPTTRCSSCSLDGATVVLQGLHRTWPPLIDFAAAADHRARPPGAGQRLRDTRRRTRASRAHYDVHDVFVLQVAGEKRWTHPRAGARGTRCATSRGPTTAPRSRRGRRSEPVIDTVLRPGDALYLPRGWLHAAEALGDGHLPPDRRRPPGHPVRTGRGADRARRRRAGAARVAAARRRRRRPRRGRADLVATVEALTDWLRTVDRGRGRRPARARRGGQQPAGPVAPAGAGRGRPLGHRLDVLRVRGALRHRLRRSTGGDGRGPEAGRPHARAAGRAPQGASARCCPDGC